MSTKIEWCFPPGYRGDTWNPVVGCSRKSSGCMHCYAEVMAARIANACQAKWRNAIAVSAEAGEAIGGPNEPAEDVRSRVLTPTEQAYQLAVRWEFGGTNGPLHSMDKALPQWSRRLIPLYGKLHLPLTEKRPTCYFVNSMSDLFHEDVPFDFIDQVFAIMALTPQHFYLILTKRPDRMAAYFRELSRGGSATTRSVIAPTHLPDSAPAVTRYQHPLPNVGLGTSVEDQATANERIPHLLRCPAALRFLSCEPLLGPVDLGSNEGGTLWIGGQRGCDGRDRYGVHHHDDRCARGIDWVITGGESGPGARRHDVQWSLNIVKECQQAGVPVFVKQLGGHVVDRNDVGFEVLQEVWAEGAEAGQPTNSRGWPQYDGIEEHINGFREEYQGAPVRIHLANKKGADMNEWPQQLRVREWPAQLLRRTEERRLALAKSRHNITPRP